MKQEPSKDNDEPLIDDPALPIRPSFIRHVGEVPIDPMWDHMRQIIEASDNSPVEYTDDGLVSLTYEEAQQYFDVLSGGGIDTDLGPNYRWPIMLYGKSECTLDRFYHELALRRSSALGRELITSDDFLIKFPDRSLWTENMKYYFILVSVNVSNISPREAYRGNPDMEESGKRGHLILTPTLDWVAIVTSRNESAGILVFKQINTSTTEQQLQIRWLAKRQTVNSLWQVGKEWEIHATASWPAPNHCLDQGVKDIFNPFYLKDE